MQLQLDFYVPISISKSQITSYPINGPTEVVWLFGVSCTGPGVELSDSDGSFPNQYILWTYDSMLLLGEHGVITIFMLQSEGLMCRQCFLILEGFLMQVENLFQPSMVRRLSVQLVRPHKPRVYAHSVFIMKQQIRPVEQQIVPVLSQNYKDTDGLLPRFFWWKINIFLLTTKKANWMFTIWILMQLFFLVLGFKIIFNLLLNICLSASCQQNPARVDSTAQGEEHEGWRWDCGCIDLPKCTSSKASLILSWPITHSSPTKISPCCWSPSLHSPVLPGHWPCPAQPTCRMVSQLDWPGPLPKEVPKFWGCPCTPCPAPGWAGTHLPTLSSPHSAQEMLTSPDFLLMAICGTTALLCLEDKVYTGPSLPWKKGILNISLLHTNKCLWCTNSHRPRGGVLSLEELQELGKQYENKNKDEQPRWLTPKSWEATRAPAPWKSVLLAQGQSQGLVAPVPECQPREQPGSHCCFAVKPLYTGHTSPDSQVLSLLTGLFPVPTKKESIFWLPGCVRCLLHKECFLPSPTLTFYMQKF